MDSLMLTPLDALEKSLNSLVTSLTTSPSLSAAPVITKDLLSADDALTTALVTLKQHQDNHAHILHLQAEAERLRERLKSVVRTCGALRSEIGGIDPEVLEDPDSDDDGEGDHDGGKNTTATATALNRQVDYKTLLSFAARIGKHNAAAAREAEAESLRQRIAANNEKKRKTAASTTVMTPPTPINGHVVSTGAAGAEPAEGTVHEAADDAADPANLPAGSKEMLDAINRDVAARRAAQGMAFPAAELLRVGALGRLQLLRERAGEDEVLREVQRLEGLPADEDEGNQGGEAMLLDEQATPALGPVQEGKGALPAQEPQQQQQPEPRPRRVSGGRVPRPAGGTTPPPPKKLELDMWQEDDDDD